LAAFRRRRSSPYQWFLLRKIFTQLKKRGGKITREISEFRGSRRFYFREPCGGEFAMWSDK
jgi:predicted enzyme related to lactoylglutathione lyase